MNGNLSDVEKRRKQRRKKARKKHLTVLSIVLFLFALTVFALLSITVLFPIKNVTASGSIRYKEEEILKAADLDGKNIFSFGTAKTEGLIRKKLPFADNITFERHFPDTVSIKVKDATEYASYRFEGKSFTVSKNGYILSDTDLGDSGLLTVEVSKAAGSVGEKLLISNETEKEVVKQITEFFEKSDLKLNSLDVSNVNDIKAVVLDKYSVEFGTRTYLDKKCSHLKGMLNNIDKQYGGTINVSMWTPQKNEGTFIKSSAEKQSF